MVASRVSRTLSRLKREGGISLEKSQQKRASSRVEGRISWFSSVAAGNLGFLSSYDGVLRDLFIGLRKVQSPCELRVASQDSSPVGARS